MNKIAFVNFALILLIIVPFATGLGISPGRVTEDFSSGMSKTVDLKIINTERKDFDASLYVKGELSDYVTLSKNKLSFSADEKAKTISYDIKLPSELKRPGLHKSEIVVREVKKGAEDEGMVIGALVAVVSQLHVKVPYPGKFVEAKLDIIGAKLGDPVLFFIPVINLGTETTDSVKATIFIFDPDGEEIARIESNEISLRSKQKSELSAVWKNAEAQGVYKAVVVVDYDGRKAKTENMFMVGEFFLEVLDISVRDFSLGDIAKFNILVQNVGNKEILRSYARMFLRNEEGQQVADIKSLDTDLPPFSKEEFTGYWDTKGIVQGSYTGKISLHYEDKIKERQIKTYVTQDDIKTEIIGITGMITGIDTEVPAGKPVNIPWTGIVIAVLVIMNIVWLLYFKTRKD